MKSSKYALSVIKFVTLPATGQVPETAPPSGEQQ